MPPRSRFIPSSARARQPTPNTPSISFSPSPSSSPLNNIIIHAPVDMTTSAPSNSLQPFPPAQPPLPPGPAPRRQQLSNDVLLKNRHLARELNAAKLLCTSSQKAKSELHSANLKLESVIRGLTHQANQLTSQNIALGNTVDEQDESLRNYEVIVKALQDEITSLKSSDNEVYNALGKVVANNAPDTHNITMNDSGMWSNLGTSGFGGALGHFDKYDDAPESPLGSMESMPGRSPLREPRFDSKMSPTAELRQFHKQRSSRRASLRSSGDSATSATVSPPPIEATTPPLPPPAHRRRHLTDKENSPPMPTSLDIHSPPGSPPAKTQRRSNRNSLSRVDYKEPAVNTKLRKGDVQFGGVGDSLAFIGRKQK